MSLKLNFYDTKNEPTVNCVLWELMMCQRRYICGNKCRNTTLVERRLIMEEAMVEKAEEPEIKLPTSIGSSKKQESSRKTSTSALLIMPKALTVQTTTNSGKFLEVGLPNHLTCLLRTLYAGQEATVRTVQGTTDGFQIGKGVRQGCILSPCLFNLYAEYIMRNARLDEAQAGIKISRRNINNLR